METGAATSGAAEAPAGPRRICFTTDATKGDGGYAARRVRAFGEAAGVLLCFLVFMWILDYFLPSQYSAPIAGGLALGVLILRWILGRVRREDVERARAMVARSEGAAKVVCRGRLNRLARIVALEPIEDRMFEPVVFLAVASTPSPRRKQVVQIIAGVAIVALGAWSEVHFLHRMTAPYFLFLAAIGGAMLVGGAVYPTYLRIVPGRIDVMECALLGRRIIHVRRIDVRTRTVTIDLNRQMLTIDTVPKIETIPFAAIWDRWGFAHAVLMASISTHTPPPLPDDELVG